MKCHWPARSGMPDRATHTLSSQKKSELGKDARVINWEVVGNPPEWMTSLTRLIEVSIFFSDLHKGQDMWERLWARREHYMREEKYIEKEKEVGRQRKDGPWSTIIYTYHYSSANTWVGFTTFSRLKASLLASMVTGLSQTDCFREQFTVLWFLFNLAY